MQIGCELSAGLRVVEDLGPGRGWLASRDGESLRVFPAVTASFPPPPDHPRLASPRPAGEGWVAFPYHRKTLADLLSKGPLGLLEALRLTRGILEAQEALAAAGCPRPPLCPSLVFLDELGEPLLPGIPVAIEASLLAPYRPPELRDEAAPVGLSGDVHVAGALFYAALTGAAPEGLRPPPPSSREPSVPTWLDRVVLMALEVDPGHRYPVPQTFRAALGAAENALLLAARRGTGADDVSTSRPRPPAPAPGSTPGFMSPTGRWGQAPVRSPDLPGAGERAPGPEPSPPTTPGAAMTGPGPAVPAPGAAPRSAPPEPPAARPPVRYRFSWRATLTRGLPVLLGLGVLLALLLQLVRVALRGSGP